MDEKLTRKDFLTAAAAGAVAVGAAALVPTKYAMANPEEKEIFEVSTDVEELLMGVMSDELMAAVDIEPSDPNNIIINSDQSIVLRAHANTVGYQSSLMLTDGIATLTAGSGSPSEYGNGAVVSLSSQGLHLWYKSNSRSGTLSDWVTESGSSGIWTYQKWASGKFECWGKTGNISAGTTVPALGSYYCSYSSVATIPGGWFIQTPQVWINYSLNSNGLLNSVNTWGLHTNNRNIGITCMSNAYQAGLLLVCDFHCIGRWK